MGKTIHLLVDYKDGAGRYYHQVFKAYNALGEETAAACVMEMLRQDGVTPWAVAAVYGSHTMEELSRMQDSPPVPGKTRILYIDKTEYQARSPG
mgnify:FL=1